MNLQLLKSKLRALAIHLSISLLIFAGLMAIILWWWFPGIWFSIDGGWQGVRIVAFVDLVLGPLLTLIIFNPAKTRRHMTFDLGCIALVQVAALTWGIYTVHGQRLLAVVYWDDSIYTVREADLAEFGKTSADLGRISDELPLWVAARPPENDEERTAVAIASITGGPQMFADMERYEPIEQHSEAMASHSIDIAAKAELSDALSAALKKFMSRQDGKSLNDFIFLPFNGRFGTYTIIIDRNSHIVGYLPPASG